jgi:large subunit ribosomal protein L31
MKADIHPQWFDEALVTCSCGQTFVTGSTKPAIKVEICGSCHPFYTGEQRIVDTEGRVARLKRKYNL